MAKDNYKGPSLEEMDRAARMMEANIPPVAPSKLDGMGIDITKIKAAKMPELKTKDTGDKNEVELKGQKIKGYENAKPMKKGGSVSSASKRADGCATKGKTKGRII